MLGWVGTSGGVPHSCVPEEGTGLRHWVEAEVRDSLLGKDARSQEKVSGLAAQIANAIQQAFHIMEDELSWACSVTGFPTHISLALKSSPRRVCAIMRHRSPSGTMEYLYTSDLNRNEKREGEVGPTVIRWKPSTNFP